MFMHKTS